MDYFFRILYYALLNMLNYTLLALFVENTILSRAIGTSSTLFLVRKKSSIFLFGAVLTLVVTISAVLVRYIEPLLSSMEDAYYYRPLVYILIITVVYLFTLFLEKTFIHNLETRRALFKMTHLSAFNCISLGALLLPTQLKTTLLSSYVGFGIGTGLGFILSTWFVSVVHTRLHRDEVPKSFKGMPITLLYIGILSLVIYGFVGHELPF